MGGFVVVQEQVTNLPRGQRLSALLACASLATMSFGIFFGPLWIAIGLALLSVAMTVNYRASFRRLQMIGVAAIAGAMFPYALEHSDVFLGALLSGPWWLLLTTSVYFGARRDL